MKLCNQKKFVRSCKIRLQLVIITSTIRLRIKSFLCKVVHIILLHDMKYSLNLFRISFRIFIFLTYVKCYMSFFSQERNCILKSVAEASGPSPKSLARTRKYLTTSSLTRRCPCRTIFHNKRQMIIPRFVLKFSKTNL